MLPDSSQEAEGILRQGSSGVRIQAPSHTPPDLSPSSLCCRDKLATCSPTAASRSSATALLFGVWFHCWIVKWCPSDGPGNEHLTPFLAGSRKEMLLPGSHKARCKQLASLPCQVTKSTASRRLQSAKWSS